MKNFKKNSIILLCVTIAILAFILKDNYREIVNALTGANMVYIFIAIFCFILGLAFQARAYQEIIEEYNHKYTFFKAYKMLLITKFFNGITPFSTGGQPMQIYMLKKDGFRFTKATNIIIQNFIIFQAALVLFGLLAIGINYFNHIFEEVSALKILVTVGFITNTIVMLGLIVISFSNKFNHFILNKIANFLDRLHLLKDKEAFLTRWREKIDDFYEGTEYLKNNKLLCLRTFIYNILYLGLVYAMPFFVVIAIHKSPLDGLTIFKTICASAYVLIVGSFVPIPGGSIGIEGAYLHFFGNFMHDPLLSASLIIWRSITYYLPMVVGGILFSVSTKRDDKTCE